MVHRGPLHTTTATIRAQRMASSHMLQIAVRISAPKHEVDQQAFFTDTHNLSGKAHARTVIGNYFDALTAKLVNGKRHLTDATAQLCPDVTAGMLMIEVKSCRKSGIIWEAQLRNYERAAALGYTVFFLFWLHEVDLEGMLTAEQLRAALGRNHQVLAIPLDLVLAYCTPRRRVLVRYRGAGNGHLEKSGYAWRPTGAALRKLAGTSESVNRDGITVQGRGLGLLWPLTMNEQAAASAMAEELDACRLEVAYVPAPDGGDRGRLIRRVVNRNPAWYRKLCTTRTTKRVVPRAKKHGDTDIRRRFVEAALNRLCQGMCITSYDWLVRPYVEARSRAVDYPLPIGTATNLTGTSAPF